MYKEISDKQLLVYAWRDCEALNDCDTLLATGAIRTGKTEIGSKGWGKDALKLVRATPKDYRTKGYNLFAIVSTTKSLALLNIVEPMIKSLEQKGYRECRTARQFYRAKGNVFVHTTHPMGLVQVKDYYGNVTRFLYIGADNKRALIKVTGLTLRGWFLDEAPLLAGNEDDNHTFIQRMYERTATFMTEPYGRPLQVMTTNPQSGQEGKFYQSFIKGGRDKGIAVVSFHMLDNPIFTEKDVERYRKILTKNQFARKIEGKWVKDNEVATFPKFNHKDHVTPHSQVMGYNYVELCIGLDEGQRDARSFVLTGFTQNYEKEVKYDEYYYKNEPEKEIKDINDYVKEFWEKAQQWYDELGKPMEVKYDSAALYIVEPLKRYKLKHYPHLPVIIRAVNKRKELTKVKGKNSAINERTDYTNIIMGAKILEVSDRCTVLIDTYDKCVNKNGTRVDDGKTNKIDILDASEYGDKHRIKLIQTRIMMGGANNGVKQRQEGRHFIGN